MESDCCLLVNYRYNNVISLELSQIGYTYLKIGSEWNGHRIVLEGLVHESCGDLACICIKHGQINVFLCT